MDISTVGVIGLGYIGLPTAAILASAGVKVVGVDICQSTVDAVNCGVVPFVEPGLCTFVEEAVRKGTLRASLTPEPADVFIVAVPTPFQGDHEPDLHYIKEAAQTLAPQLTGGELLVLESTSPPGATAKMAQWVLDVRPDLSLDGSGGRPVIHVAHCPERVLPGRAMVELVTNDRIIGGLTRQAAEMAKDLYATFCHGELLLTDAVTAEMAKLVENSYRDVNIAFANELSLISDKLGIDVWELIELANHHPRVNILQPGPGVGGHCIAIDPWFIVDTDPEQSRLIRTAREVNDGKPEWVMGKICQAISAQDAPTIALLGLAFKPDIDDLRESPACKIAGEVADRFTHSRVMVVEPNIDQLPDGLANRRNTELAGLAPAVSSADVVVVLVDHSEFRTDLPALLAQTEAQVIDAPGTLRRMGVRPAGMSLHPELVTPRVPQS